MNDFIGFFSDTRNLKERSQPGGAKLVTYSTNDNLLAKTRHTKLNAVPENVRKNVNKKALSLNPRWTRTHVGTKKKKQFIIANLPSLGVGNTPVRLVGGGDVLGTGTGDFAQDYGVGLVTNAGVLSSKTNLDSNYVNTDGFNYLSAGALGAADSTNSNAAMKSALSDYATGTTPFNSIGSYGNNGMQNLDSSNVLSIMGNSLNGGSLGTSRMMNAGSILGAENSASMLGTNTASMFGGGLDGMDSLSAAGLSQNQNQGIMKNDDLYSLEQSLGGKLNTGDGGLEEKLEGGGRQGIGSCKY